MFVVSEYHLDRLRSAGFDVCDDLYDFGVLFDLLPRSLVIDQRRYLLNIRWTGIEWDVLYIYLGYVGLRFRSVDLVSAVVDALLTCRKM